jgi:ketosteroid isomerase-like protein
MTQAGAYAIVQDYHQAWTSGDIDRAKAQVADFTVRDGKIAESVLIFDRISFGPHAEA